MRKKPNRQRRSATIHVTVSYDGELPALIGGAYQDWEMESPATFVELFANIVQRFPVLTHSYPPGAIGILINGQPVIDPAHPLADGDIVGFVAPMPMFGGGVSDA